MPESDQQIEARLVNIESAMAHLQHDVDQLSSSLTEHFRRLQSFEARFSRIENDLESLAEGPDVRSPEDEKPPHY